MRLGRAAAMAALCFCPMAPVLAGDISPQANRELLVANAKKPGVVVLPSGLQYRVITSGSGQTPTLRDTVKVLYRGALVDGIVFDETMPGEPRDLAMERLIPGWVEALSLMKEGDEWELVVPSALGYGAVRAGGGKIPPNQNLVFSMQLIAVIRAAP
jgi:FKBP-type peptidyl-prolyl cis-trans isomerase FklB